MKKFPVVGLVVLSMGAATLTRVDDGRYLKTKAVFAGAPGLRIESALASVSPDSNGTYDFRGTCFEPDGETWTGYVRIDLLAGPSTDPGVGDFFAEEELPVVEFDGFRYEFDQERKIYFLAQYLFSRSLSAMAKIICRRSVLCPMRYMIVCTPLSKLQIFLL